MPNRARTAPPASHLSVLDPYVPDRGDAAYAVTHYDLDLDYKVSSNRLAGKAVLDVVAREEIARLHVDLVGLRIAKVTVDGRPAKWVHRGPRVLVTLPAPLTEGARAQLAISYAGTPGPVRTRWGDVGWEELAEGALVASQPSGAATWFPCNDHPRNKATFRIAFECDSPFEVVATGTLTSSRTRASRTRRVFEQRHPMATYLAAIQVGPYTRFSLAERPVRQDVLMPSALQKPVLADLGRQPEMVEAFEQIFGPYPYDAYTVVVTPEDLEIPLEAQGMATFGPNWLRGRGREERLVAHELAHQWFGNSLTIGTWQDIWLNEGFACYAEWLWAEQADGIAAGVSAQEHWQRLAALPQDLVLADPGPELMFDDRVYKRGALTLHALRLKLGDDRFFTMLREWVRRHAHGTVRTADFVEHVLRHSDTSATHALLESWLWDRRLPALSANGR